MTCNKRTYAKQQDNTFREHIQNKRTYSETTREHIQNNKRIYSEQQEDISRTRGHILNNKRTCAELKMRKGECWEHAKTTDIILNHS